MARPCCQLYFIQPAAEVAFFVLVRVSRTGAGAGTGAGTHVATLAGEPSCGRVSRVTMTAADALITFLQAADD